MSVGLAITKAELDARTGDVARQFQAAFDNVAILKLYLDATIDEELVALGYTPEDIATLKTAFVDLAELGTIWTGNATLAAEKDFRVFVRRIWGVGARVVAASGI